MNEEHLNPGDVGRRPYEIPVASWMAPDGRRSKSLLASANIRARSFTFVVQAWDGKGARILNLRTATITKAIHAYNAAHQ
jgi:hypothetical protein